MIPEWVPPVGAALLVLFFLVAGLLNIAEACDEMARASKEIDRSLSEEEEEENENSH